MPVSDAAVYMPTRPLCPLDWTNAVPAQPRTAFGERCSLGSITTTSMRSMAWMGLLESAVTCVGSTLPSSVQNVRVRARKLAQILRSPNLVEGLHDGRHDVGSQLVWDALLARRL